MSKASILVNLKHNARKAKNEIKKNLKKVDKTKMRPSLNIQDKDIERVQAKLATLSKNRTAKVKAKVDKRSFAKAKTQKKLIADGGKNLPGVDASGRSADFRKGSVHTDSGVLDLLKDRKEIKDVQIDKADISEMGISAKNFPSFSEGMSYNEKAERWMDEDGNFAPKRTGLTQNARSTGNIVGGGTRQSWSDSAKPSGGGLSDTPFGPKLPTQTEKVTNKIKEYENQVRNATDAQNMNIISGKRMRHQARKFGQTLRKYSPNIMVWWKLVAMLLPMVITLAVQFAGVAVAMGAVVGAGAAMMGLGLIGHGEAIADSFGLAERQLNKLKRELFQTFKPALAEFAPISGEFMQKLPQRVEPLVQPLQDLTIFEDTFISGFNGVVDWVGEVADTLVNYAEEIDQISHRFGEILGSGFINMLEWLIETAYDNQEVMIHVMSVFKSVIGSVWNLLQALTLLLSLLEPVFTMFHSIMKLLDNKWGATLVFIIGLLYVLTGILTSLIAGWKAWSTLLAANNIMATANALGRLSGAMAFYTGKVWAAVAANKALAAAIAATGIGAIMVGAGYASGRLMNSESGIDDSRQRTGNNGAHSGSTTINNDITVNAPDGEEGARKIQDMDADEWYSHKSSEEEKTTF